MAADLDRSGWARVTPGDMHDFSSRCLLAAGMKAQFAQDLADLLVAADHRGHYSHGLNRLDMYIDEVTRGLTEKDGEPTVVKETVATALVDGNNIPGPTIGKFCMNLAIKKAKEAGVAWVSAKNSNHFGIAGYYSMMASKEGMMGMACTNTSPLVVPTRAKKPMLGTNPISVSAPGPEGNDFVLDMATSAVALGKVELARRKGGSIPNGWGCDSDGKETNDPAAVQADGGLLPLGGMEATGGYKGYGLMMMVEYFCSILSGATTGPNVRSWKLFDRKADLGQCYVAVNPEAFGSGFTERSGHLMDTMRNLQPAEGQSEILVAGDPERKHMEECDQLGGIPYHPNQIQFAKDLAKRLNIEEMKTV